jgi:hypothetical protein
MRFNTLFSAVLIGLCLTGCSSHSKAYLTKGNEISPLVVPHDAPVLKQQTYYPVPAMPAGSTVKKSVSLLPPTLQKN